MSQRALLLVSFLCLTVGGTVSTQPEVRPAGQ